MTTPEAVVGDQQDAVRRVYELVHQAGAYALDKVCDFSNRFTPNVAGQNRPLVGRETHDLSAPLDPRG